MARAHFQVDGHRGRPVDQVVAVAGAFRDCRAVASPQKRLATVLDERHFAFEQLDDSSSSLCQWRWLDQPPGGRVIRLTPKSRSPPASPRRCRVRALQGASNGDG